MQNEENKAYLESLVKYHPKGAQIPFQSGECDLYFFQLDDVLILALDPDGQSPLLVHSQMPDDAGLRTTAQVEKMPSF